MTLQDHNRMEQIANQACSDFYRNENYKSFSDDMMEYLSFTKVPEQYRSKVYSVAYDRGHAYGSNEVFSVLQDLISIFE